MTMAVIRTGKYWMDNTQCGGHELEMSECRFDSWGENDCDPSEAAGVVCSSPEAEKPKLKTKYSFPGVTVAAKKVLQKYRINVIAILSSYYTVIITFISAGDHVTTLAV